MFDLMFFFVFMCMFADMSVNSGPILKILVLFERVCSEIGPILNW